MRKCYYRGIKRSNPVGAPQKLSMSDLEVASEIFDAFIVKCGGVDQAIREILKSVEGEGSVLSFFTAGKLNTFYKKGLGYIEYGNGFGRVVPDSDNHEAYFQVKDTKYGPSISWLEPHDRDFFQQYISDGVRRRQRPRDIASELLNRFILAHGNDQELAASSLLKPSADEPRSYKVRDLDAEMVFAEGEGFIFVGKDNKNPFHFRVKEIGESLVISKEFKKENPLSMKGRAVSRLTINKVNKEIQKKINKDLLLIKGEGYFYFVSENEKLGNLLSGIDSASVYVYKINDLSLDQWVREAENVMEKVKKQS